jgi:nucleoside-diphosphate-sugar epimerase
MKYAASKILAHQATRDFLRDEKPTYKIITFHPCFVIGESLIQTSLSNMDAINGYLWQSFALKEPLVPSAFVDVKQCAEAHVKVLQALPKLTTGREYVLASPVKGWKSLVKYLKDEFPDVEVNIGCGPFPLKDEWELDSEPARRELGIVWKDVNEIVREMLMQQLEFKRNERAKGSL